MCPAHTRPTVYLESRYRKLARGLPQTIHFCPTCKGDRRRRHDCAACAGRGKLSADSVQELIGRVLLPAFRARTGKFHGAGREDVDVLMLGPGRPFVFELVRAGRTDVDLDRALADIHAAAAGRIELSPLRPCARERVAFWKSAELEKTYRARVVLEPRPAAAAWPAALLASRLAIDQHTPQRVAHRRGDMVRHRWVEVQALEPAGEGAVDVVLRCAHGTYVKEWISGDGGRTVPSFADLVGVRCTCQTLDVLDVASSASAGVPTC